MRPVVRILKHASLALFLIAAGTCMLEVGLRTHHLQTVLEGQKASPDACLSRPCPLTYQHLPFSYDGFYRSAETGRDVEIQTNILGMRGPEVAIPKPPGIYRIVCLGDDATLAPSIAEEQTFCHLLQAKLQERFDRQVDVINAGQPGHCPLLSLAWSRARLLGLQPDLVILFCDASDVSDDRHCRPLARFDNEGTLLSVANPAAKERPTDWFAAVEEEFILARLLGEQLGDRITEQFAAEAQETWPNAGLGADGGGEPGRGHPSAAIEQTWEPLAGLQELCRQISAEFVVAVVPSSDSVRSAEVLETTGGPDRIGEMLALLAKRANEEQIPLLDASAEFARQKERTDLLLESSGALSTEGHQLFADILGQALMARRHRESVPLALPVSGEVPAAPEPEQTAPLPTLERRPRATGEFASERKRPRAN